MFKLIVTLFLISNGVQSEQPLDSISNKTKFQTHEACIGHLDSDQGKRSKQQLEMLLGSMQKNILVKITCVEIKDSTI